MAISRARKKTMTDAELAAYTLFDIKRRKKAQKDYESQSLQYGNASTKKKRKKRKTGYA